MLRTIAIRNESILRGTLSNAVRSRTRVALRLLSTQATRKQQIFRLSDYQLKKPQQTSVWSTNFIRAYSNLPDHIKVTLPALSPTMEQGTIVSWEKKEGDKLNEGDLLAEIETDKATMGFETPEEGYLAKILVQAGEKDVAIGKLVCIIVENEADVAAFKDFKDDGSAAPAPKKAAEAPAPAAAPTPVAVPVAAPAPDAAAPTTAAEQSGKRVYASPMAKNLAEKQKLRLEGKGSGIFGSITSADLAGKSAAGAPAAGKAAAPSGPGAYIDIPVSNIRGVIAKRLKESKQQIPHYYLTVECNVDKLMKLREKVNKQLEKEKMRVSLNDFIIKATAIACRKVPETNSYWMDTVIRQFDNVDVSVAVSTERGLITPIVFGADRKGVVLISREVKALAAKARDNKLKPHEFQGGTVSVSNLGMFGVNNFCAVINPPQSCILAVGTTTKKLVVDPKELKGFKEINVLTVTLSADHRTVDGAVGAKWLQHFREFMEDPASMIL
ncbi:dihydrolipoyllysine-residue acetyltransferase component of pyruvate dehydrogenase complex, mitochondrial isoform X1 [Eupeodes corollae]|uniref:dihydrolipoyllysine-residue acetyltransferase component of pyruvate dehydrogenase complex, mitochondrial isoform X1 n=1 Tax=Eupeodes corollae TaxID=290404 RepID=UPI002493456A|nr:dihydrolipoyllysine-residue acetyltransferase component of pyruvate dehydrogenase complex, mitochondrial isoform X1 [Eupeodes corollae]